MHIPDGIIPAQVCAGGYALTGLTTWYVLRQIRRGPDPSEAVPKAALLAAAFFIGSSINIPVPPVSVHLVLNGLLGALLGWYAWPAILIGLFLQALLIGHGGLTTLGVNAVMMGLPALIARGIFQLRYPLGARLPLPWALGIAGFGAGALGIGLAALIFFGVIVFTIPSEFTLTTERNALLGLMVAHIPLMLIEGTFTTLLMLFLHRVKPELLKSQGG
ncbi:MAG: cobalt transporter CbiM [Leptolyngbyaceae cyanobacterium]